MSQKNANIISALCILAFPFLLVTTIVSGIVSGSRYLQAIKQIEFLKEVERSATVDTATDALERGMPFLEKHFADSMELRILQSNLDYLKQQPPQTLVPLQIKESISVNANSIHYEFTSGGSLYLVFLVSTTTSSFICLCILL